MIHDVAIIFIHYDDDPITMRNFLSFKDKNPDVPIIPLASANSWPLIPLGNSFVSEKLTPKQDAWGNVDIMIYDYYLNKEIESKRWVIAEWDTFCNMSVREFYKDVWDQDISTASIRIKDIDPDWHWWKCQLPDRFAPFATGFDPIASLMFSDLALGAISRLHLISQLDVFAELRIGTYAKFLNFTPVVNKSAFGKIRWRPFFDVKDCGPGIWHPVKA